MSRRKFWWDFIVRCEAEVGGGDPASGDPAGGEPGAGEPAGDPAGGGSGGEADPSGSQEPTGDESKPAPWPDDWRARMSKGDEKISQRLSRYTSPEAVTEALIAAQNKISSGQLKTALPENATDEELKQWRSENGIPESPDKYDLKFDSGLVIGEEDKPIVDDYLKSAHAVNLTPEQAKHNIEWYFATQEKIAEEREALDDVETDQASDELNVEWGSEYRRNVNMIQGVIDKFPQKVQDALKSARLPGGKALFNDADILRGFASIALEINPAGTLVPANMGDPLKGIDDEIAAIETTMRENRGKYNKDEKMQARHRELLDAKKQLKARQG